MHKIFTLFAATLIFAGSSLFATGANEQKKLGGSEENKKYVLPLEPKKPAIVTTNHTLTLPGKSLPYQAHTGFFPILKEGKESAQIFFTAYFAEDPAIKNRPITFCFNGGPGASSIWLHMGALGPVRVKTNDIATTPSPAQYEANPYTLLASSDLVFVDPVSTGFSKPAEGVEAKQFYGFEEDIASMTEFVRAFTCFYNRWNDPKFLLGESYGTVRIVGLADQLYEKHFLQVNGLILISSCIDFLTQEISYPNDLAQLLQFPSCAATAWYHKKLSPELLQKNLEDFLEEVEEFSLTEYASALIQGDSLPEARMADIAAKLAKYTGIPREQYLKNALRMSNAVFRKQLLENDAMAVGRFDGRMKGFVMDPENAAAVLDPSIDGIAGAYLSSFETYLHNDLNFQTTDAYNILNREVHPWNFGKRELQAGLGFLDVKEQLKAALIQNPNLSVYVASGYYDMATPYLATDYNLNHLFLPKPLQKQLQHSFFEAGHLMYQHEPSLVKLATELREFTSH